MPEYNNSARIGDFAIRPTEGDGSQIERLKNYDSAVGYAGHDRLHAMPPSFYQIDLVVLTSANNNTVRSAGFKAPWPFTILAADVACETCAAVDGTVDVLVDGVSVLDAAESVKATLTTPKRVAPEDGSQDVDYDSEVYINQTATSAAAMVGGQAHMYVQRL